MAGVVLMGILGYILLPVSALPPVDFPTIQIVSQYPGASPEVMETTVTTPLERQMGQISGLTTMTSVSSAGTSTITLQFSLDRDIDSASQDVQAAMQRLAQKRANEARVAQQQQNGVQPQNGAQAEQSGYGEQPPTASASGGPATPAVRAQQIDRSLYGHH